ncbi:MAG: DNA adenine methylase [Pseudomonadota bacterium]
MGRKPDQPSALFDDFVRPVQPVAAWVGGKKQLAKPLCRIIDAHPHQTYVEPFVGMGGVFFRRRRAAPVEVINDLSRDVTNLFRILREHFPAFIGTLKYQMTSRDEFNRLSDMDPDTLTDFQRAARFLYLQRVAFGGKVTGQSFGVANERPGRFNLTTLEPMLQDVYERLAGVVIECLPWQDVLEKYDHAGAMFYLDPPYHGSEHYYGRGMFAFADYQQMAERLAELKGRFVLSINDTPEIRDVFEGFRIEEANVTYTVNDGDPTQATELIIQPAP